LQVEPVRSGTPILYVARMTYPAPAQALPSTLPPPAPKLVAVNDAYTATGSSQVQPSRIFDDGTATYFEWPKDKSLPAIFAISEDGSESLVNTNVRGDYVVVDQIATRFRLRDGKNVVTVLNQAAAHATSRP
jgi:type IV secretion system protein VirB9